MIKEAIKNLIDRLPPRFAGQCKYICRKVLRFFDGRDIADGMLDFNKLPHCHELKKGEKSRLALVYNVYYQHNRFHGFIEQLQKYETFSSEILKKLEIIIIDDGSPCPLPLPELNLNISLLRIKKDIPWNGGGARNLGACYATAEKLLFCDIDHFIPEETINDCMETILEDNAFYTLEWKEPVYVIPNIFCIKKKTFFSLHGYDEIYSGFYGDDVFFRKYLEECGVNIIRTGWLAVNSAEQYFGEHKLSRSLSTARRKLRKKAKFEHSDCFLNFPWFFIKSHQYVPKGGNR